MDRTEMDEALRKIERNVSLLRYVFDSIVEGGSIQSQDVFEGAVWEILSGLQEGLEKAKEING